MKYLVCVDSRGWEAVVRGAARYLPGGPAEDTAGSSESIVAIACVVDERATSSYSLSLRGLLGRTPRSSGELSPVFEDEMSLMLAEAAESLRAHRTGLTVEPLLLYGKPNEELVRATHEGAFDSVLIGRGSPGADRSETLSGTVAEWKRNPHGDLDGFYLQDGAEVRFPPHRAPEVRRVAGEGSVVEVRGERRDGSGHLHAYEISCANSGETVEAHGPPGARSDKARKVHIGHTARFVLDHVSCDVILIS